MTPGSEVSPAAYHARRPGAPRVLVMSRLTATEARIAALLYPERNYWRPKTRGDCADAPRPCPYVSCRHHLYLDVAYNGSIRIAFPDREVWELEDSCSLDVAERIKIGRNGSADREQVGALLNRCGARVEQIEREAIGQFRHSAQRLREHL